MSKPTEYTPATMNLNVSYGFWGIMTDNDSAMTTYALRWSRMSAVGEAVCGEGRGHMRNLCTFHSKTALKNKVY